MDLQNIIDHYEMLGNTPKGYSSDKLIIKVKELEKKYGDKTFDSYSCTAMVHLVDDMWIRINSDKNSSPYNDSLLKQPKLKGLEKFLVFRSTHHQHNNKVLTTDDEGYGFFCANTNVLTFLFEVITDKTYIGGKDIDKTIDNFVVQYATTLQPDGQQQGLLNGGHLKSISKYYDAKCHEYHPHDRVKEILKITRVLANKDDSVRVAFLDKGDIIVATPEHVGYTFLDEKRNMYCLSSSYTSDNKFIKSSVYSSTYLPLWIDETKNTITDEILNELQELDKYGELSKINIPVEISDITSIHKRKEMSIKRKELQLTKQDEARELYITDTRAGKKVLLEGFTVQLDKDNSEPHVEVGTVWYEGQKVTVNNPVKITEGLLNEQVPDLCSCLSRAVRDLLPDNSGWYSNRLQMPFTYHVGNFKVTVDKKVFDKGSQDTVRYYIDDIRINKDELPDVVSAGLSFKKKKAYIDYLKLVTKTSLYAQDKISNGYIMSVMSMGEPYKMRFTFKKEGTQWHIGDYENWYSINRGLLTIKKMSNNSGGYYTGTSLKSLKDTLIEANMTQENVAKLVRGAVKEYLKAKVRAEKLLNETIGKYKDKVSRDAEGNIKVKGTSGKVYTIKDGNTVYLNDRHICIVDKGEGRQLNDTDKKIARIFALMNDSLIADKVYTLRN